MATLPERAILREFDPDSLRIGPVIGRGGQAKVYEADLCGHKVAVKEYKSDQDAAGLKILIKLNHQNIVQLWGTCLTPQFVMVFQWCPTNLHEELGKEEDLSFAKFNNWVQQISNGMDYLHEANVIHRDLKPANILLDKAHNIRICDFDYSKQQLSSSKSDMKTCCGTSLWMAPEVSRRESYNCLVDVWGFGVVLWQMLTQQTPYDGCKNTAEKAAVGKASLPSPSNLSIKWRSLLRRCLSFDADGRPKFAEIRQRLSNFEAIDSEEWALLKETWRHEKFTYIRPTESSFDLTNTCRNRQHLFHVEKLRSGSSASCDVCSRIVHKTMQICKACLLTGHQDCLNSTRLNCVPLPSRRLHFDTVDEFNYCPVSHRIPDIYPHIPHHIVYGMLELEKRKLMFRFLRWDLDVEEDRVLLLLQFYNSRRCDRLLCNEANDLVQRIVWHVTDDLPHPGIFCSKTISEEFLEHVKNEAVESIKWFIEHNVPEEWKSIMAMIFTNWHMYGPGQVDEWSMFCAVTYCIGIELDEELWPQLNEVMMRIDFDFWNRYLRCDSRTLSESNNE